ncbi:MAG: PilZ domain-containing protein [Butyrivibrio sp.]|nr:PilZ domain-containing protein [Butyrivibrio sp.]
MVNKRRAKRVKVTLELTVSSLFDQDNDKINIDSPIMVKDISKYGLGFISKSILPINYYFNAALKLGSDESTLYCVVKIIRCEALEDDEYSYGCEFVGLAPVLDYIFEDLENNS